MLAEFGHFVLDIGLCLLLGFAGAGGFEILKDARRGRHGRRAP